MDGFKNFLLKGNLVELAVAFVMAAAFGTVVTATVNLITGLVGKIGGQPDLSAWAPGDLPFGLWVNAVIGFVILSAVVYFLIVQPYTKAKERYFPTAEEEVGTPADIVLLTEIRDSLKTRG